MQIFLILALLVALVAVIFAVQNVAAVSISFFAWNIHVPLAVALLVALGAGVLITILMSIPGKVKGSWNSVSNRKRFSNLEAERDALKLKIDALAAERDQSAAALADSKGEIANLEVELANLSAALQNTGKEQDATLPPSENPPENDSAAEI